MKRILSGILIVLMMITLLAPLSLASGTQYDIIVKEVEATNAKIESMIQQAKAEADREINNFNKTNHPNAFVEAVNRLILELKIEIIARRLVTETDRLAADMIKKAANAGVTVICEYEAVQIGNKIVMIDPLIVVGF